ncbi:MAG: hypothetical protein V2A66_05145 [Pseudomonadota bacterium]
MGVIFEFTCSKCGHSVEVSGGPDCGILAVTETMDCKWCKDLVDVEVGGDSSDKSRNRLSCPKCHICSLEPWDAKKMPCPKCGGRMKRGKETEFWD